MDSVLEIERNRPQGGLGELPTFVGLPTKNSARVLSEEAAELFKAILSVLNDLLLRAIDVQTREEFIALRSQIFDDTRKTQKAMGSLAMVVIPKPTLDRLVWESFSEMEADLTEHGAKKFGVVARDQAIFTVWTLRKINRLLSRIVEGPPISAELKERDKEIAKDFSFYVYWAQFHIECLFAAMRFKKPITPDVLDEICDGLRAVVNAYGLVRQGIALRWPSQDNEEPGTFEWDEEDQELLDSSMADMEEMEIEEY
jgi:hypothetical protein